LHILIFLDQNPDSLGGAQASVLLQQKYLQLAGHTVTVVGPTNRKSPIAGSSVPGQILYKSFPLTPDGEYTATAALNRTYRFLLEELKPLPPVDVVHSQSDWWGAILANGFAKRQNLPLVHTLHTNLVTGSAAAVGALGAAILTWVNGEVFGRWVNGKALQGGIDGWKYLHNISARAQIVIAPTAHFATLATEHGVAQDIRVVPTGVDDQDLAGIFKGQKSTTKTTTETKTAGSTREVTFAWSGRFSHEKRMMEFLQAFAGANVQAKVKVFGGGPLLKKAQSFIGQNQLADRVELVGRVSHNRMLNELSAADALIQTSIGFETQGMTVYEAGVVGTPAILCDSNIAGELPANSYWLVPDSSVESLAATIRLAFEEIRGGAGKSIDLRNELYQSNLVAKSVEIYSEAIAKFKKSATK
jgi:1,2-diacylglycerol 3-alpha-glucosyltransferase